MSLKQGKKGVKNRSRRGLSEKENFCTGRSVSAVRISSADRWDLSHVSKKRQMFASSLAFITENNPAFVSFPAAFK